MPPAVAASDDRSPRAELVDRTIEDDERQDVALFERRSAGQRELRRLRGAGDVDARFDAGVRDLCASR